MPSVTSLTLQALIEAMAPALSVAVSGPAGTLERDALWLHNTELPDPSPYIRSTEVVLTNGLWRTAVDADSFVAALVAANASGLVFGLTDAVPAVPDDLVAACAAVDLPLVTLAIAVPFTAVTETAARLQSDARQDALTSLVRRGNALATALARGAGAEGVLDVLRRDHDLPLLVVDRMGRRLAGDDLPLTDEGDVNRTAAEALARHPPPLEVDLPGVGASALFLVDGAMGEIDAAVFCLRPLQSMTETERDAVGQAARFLSLEVTKQQALQAIESRFSSELLEMILSGAARAHEVSERLRAFGIDPSAQLAVLATVTGDDAVRPVGSTDEIEGFFAGLGIPAVTVPGSRDTVVVLPWSGTTGGLVELANRLIAAVARRFPDDRMVIGVGEPAADATGLREPLIRSREVCRVLRRRSTGSRVGTFADVGTHRMLLGLHDRGLLRRFADDMLGPLRDHDERMGTELERTLRVFLTNDGQWSTTASELFVHVNTLRNRVARIGELTGRDVARLEDRVDLFLAVEADALS